jgi:hypothetical protein
MLDPRLGFDPLELCSSRAAVRRLRRLCPLVVVTLFLPHRLPPTFRFLGVLRARFAALRAPLAFRALLHTRVCHFVPAVWTDASAWLFWASRPPGFSPSLGTTGPSPDFPSRAFWLRSPLHSRSCAPSTAALAPQGFGYRGDWLGLSFAVAETPTPSSPADPLELLTPSDHPRELETSTDPGVASSRIGVHRCPLTFSL